MAKINLKKLLAKDDVSAVIHDIISGIKSPVAVLDVDKKPLLGSKAEGSAGCYPIEYEGQTFGWVTGVGNVSPVVSFLKYLVRSETEKKSLAGEALDKYQELAFHYEVAEKITTCLDIKEVEGLTLTEVKRITHSDNVSIMLFNDEKNMLEVISARGIEYEPKMTIKPGEGIAGAVYSTGRPEIVNDVNNEPRYKIGKNKVSSLMCAPLKTKNKNIGVINISSVEPKSFTSTDLKIFATLASQAGIAIENAKLYDHLKESFITTVHALAETIEKRDPYTAGHTKRVMDYSLIIARSLKLPEKDMSRLKLASILHDIGKIGVRDDILLCQRKLTDEEFEAIKKHPLYGEEILLPIKYMKESIPGIKYHHERYDGKGYPDGLKGDAIDVIARIIAVADSFDAMTSNRPYRTAMHHKVALDELRKNSGTQFDPAIVDAFINANDLTTIVAGSLGKVRISI